MKNYSEGDIAVNPSAEKTANQLKLFTFIFLLIFFIILLSVGFLFWMQTESMISNSYSTPTASAEAEPTITPDSRPENGGEETGAEASSQSTLPSADETPPAQVSSTVSEQKDPGATPTPTPTPTPTRLPEDIATFTAGQNYFILWLLSAVVILFPAVLLYAFALQQVPRLVKNLDKDFKMLGIYDPRNILKLNQEITKNQKKIENILKIKPEDNRFFKLLNIRSRQSKESLNTQVFSLIQNPDSNREQFVKLINDHPNIMKKGEVALQDEKEASSLIEERYGKWEFLVPLILLTLFLLAIIAWTVLPAGTYLFASEFSVSDHSLHKYFTDTIAAMPPILVAILVAYLFSAYGLVRRYHRADITPGAFWAVLRQLLVAFLLGLAITTLFKADLEPYEGTDRVFKFLAVTASNGWTIGAILVGIFAGIFPIGALQIITRNAQVWLQKWFKERMDGKDAQEEADFSQSLRPRHDLTLLDDIDRWDVERIEEEGIVGLQGMATADLANLVTWAPFPTLQIVDWVDQAILHMAAGAEPDLSFVKTLRAMGLRGASDLVDATKDPAGKLRVVLAAQALQGKVSEDPIPAALLAGARAQLKVKDAHDKVSGVQGKKKEDDTTGIAAALDEVRAAQDLADKAHKQVKAGGDKFKDALDAATLLQATFKTASSKVDEVETALKAATNNKVTEPLASALQALGQKITADVNTQAQALVSELDKIAQPFSEIETKSKDFHEKAAAISKEAEKAPTAVPDAVTEAATMLTSLTELAQKVKQRLETESGAADAIEQVDALVKLLGDKGKEKPKALLGAERLNKKERWTDINNKASTQADAEKLDVIAKQIAAFVQAGKEALVKARAAAAVTSTGPTLTMEILENILSGLEHNPNLRRIYRYLRKATEEVSPVIRGNSTNVDWLNDKSWDL